MRRVQVRIVDDYATETEVYLRGGTYWVSQDQAESMVKSGKGEYLDAPPVERAVAPKTPDSPVILRPNRKRRSEG